MPSPTRWRGVLTVQIRRATRTSRRDAHASAVRYAREFRSCSTPLFIRLWPFFPKKRLIELGREVSPTVYLLSYNTSQGFAWDGSEVRRARVRMPARSLQGSTPAWPLWDSEVGVLIEDAEFAERLADSGASSWRGRSFTASTLRVSALRRAYLTRSMTPQTPRLWGSGSAAMARRAASSNASLWE